MACGCFFRRVCGVFFSQSLIGDWGRYFLLCVATGEYSDGDVLISIFFSEPRLLPWSSTILDSNLSVESTQEGLKRVKLQSTPFSSALGERSCPPLGAVRLTRVMHWDREGFKEALFFLISFLPSPLPLTPAGIVVQVPQQDHILWRPPPILSRKHKRISARWWHVYSGDRHAGAIGTSSSVVG